MYYCFARLPPFLLDQPAEEWARYYFDPPASQDEPSDEPYATDSIDVCELGGRDEAAVALLVLERIAELHERYAEWTLRYSAAQLSQGMWAMFSYPGSLESLLTDGELDFEPRARAMRSLVVPYRDYVKGWNPNEAMPHAWDMLWDGILAHQRSPQTLPTWRSSALQKS